MGKTPVYRFAKKFKRITPDARLLFENVLGKENELEAKEFQLDEWLENKGDELTDQEIRQALDKANNIEEEIRDSLKSIENGIQDISKMIALIQKTEQIIGEEQYSVRLELQDINRNINRMKESLTEDDADYIIKSLLDISQRLEQEAEEMRILALMVAELEKNQEKGFTAEDYLQQESEKFEQQLSTLRKIVAESGTRKQKKFEQRLEQLGQKIEATLRAEINQMAQEEGAEEITLLQLEEEVEEFSKEIQKYHLEINRVQKQLRRARLYESEKKSIEQAEENVEDALNIVADSVERMRQKQA